MLLAVTQLGLFKRINRDYRLIIAKQFHGLFFDCFLT